MSGTKKTPYEQAIEQAETVCALAAMLGGERELHPEPIYLPGVFNRQTGEPVSAVIGLISDEEIGVARAQGYLYVSKTLGIDPSAPVNRDLYWDAVTAEILARTLKDPSDEANGFKRALAPVSAIRRLLSPAQRAAAFHLVDDHQSKHDPNEAQITTEQAERIRELVKKKQPRQLARLGSSLLASYLLSTEGPHSNSPPPESSSSSSGEAQPSSS